MQDIDAIRFDEHAIRHLKTMIGEGKAGYFEDPRFPFIVFIERRDGFKPWKVWSTDTRMPKNQQLVKADRLEFGEDKINGVDAAVDMVLAVLRARIEKDQKKDSR
jgi:hypothetical protein